MTCSADKSGVISTRWVVVVGDVGDCADSVGELKMDGEYQDGVFVYHNEDDVDEDGVTAV